MNWIFFYLKYQNIPYSSTPFEKYLKKLTPIWKINFWRSVNWKIYQGSTYLFEVSSWKFVLLQPYVGPTNFPSPYNNIFLATTENKFIDWYYHFLGPTNNCLSEFSNISSRIKWKIEVRDVILLPVLLTFNIFDVLF